LFVFYQIDRNPTDVSSFSINEESREHRRNFYQPLNNLDKNQLASLLSKSGIRIANIDMDRRISVSPIPPSGEDKQSPPSVILPYGWGIDRGSMNVLIVKHVEIEGPGLIEDCLTNGKIPYRVLNLEIDPRLPRVDDFTHIVLLGGPMNVYEEDRYPFLKAEDLFIKEAIQRGKRILGICLGAQLISKALGAKVYKAAVKEIGWYSILMTEEGAKDALFSFLPKSFPAFQWHGDTFAVPPAAKLIATSSPVPNQAFRYGENAYGLQFHLEVVEGMIQEWMKEYENEFAEGEHPRFSKEEILLDTKLMGEEYSKRGRMFISRFLGLH
jgi:GMP synthase-like glutamine amidotransferase